MKTTVDTGQEYSDELPSMYTQIGSAAWIHADILRGTGIYQLLLPRQDAKIKKADNSTIGWTQLDEQAKNAYIELEHLNTPSPALIGFITTINGLEIGKDIILHLPPKSSRKVKVNIKSYGKGTLRLVYDGD